jgi:FG-GAP-like repeat
MKSCPTIAPSILRQAFAAAGRLCLLLRSAPLIAFLTLAAAASEVRSQSEGAAAAPLPLFTIKSYMGRCLNITSENSLQVGGLEPALSIADCDGSVRQQFGIEELDRSHHVRLHGAGACIEAASATDGAAVALRQCSGSSGQVFDLDGDSILLDANPDLVVQLKGSVTKASTPVVLGRRFTSDVELWDFISLDDPPRFPTTGFVIVADGPSLRAVLATAGPNTVIEIPPGTMIQFEDLPQPLAIPAGVTLRGDRRGALLGPQIWLSKGHKSTGPGDDPGLFIIQSSRSRITGLRIRGPQSEPWPLSPPPMKGVNMVVATVDQSQPPVRTDFSELVDHNDISEWTTSAVDLAGPDADDTTCPLTTPTAPQAIHVFRNYIHDNNKGGDGYGVVSGSGAYPLVFANTLQKNVHSVLTDGYAKSGYVAVANLFMAGNDSVDTDVHSGTGSTGDTHHFGEISGMAAQLVGNTFLRSKTGNKTADFALRGVPCSGVTANFLNNVSVHSASDAIGVFPPGATGTETIPWTEARPRVPYLNVDSKFSIPDPMKTFLVGDFDGDGNDDVFMATGAAWYYSPQGNAEWRFLSAKTETTDTLLIGDFDGDGRADVFKQSGDDWFVSWGGRSDWQLLSSHHRVNMLQCWESQPQPLCAPDRGILDFVIGDFVGDKRADVFFADGQNWWVSDGGTAPFELYATSSFKGQDLLFGNFDSSGKTEVASVVANQWMFVPSQGPHQWTPLRPKLTDTMKGLIAADFNGDGITDIALPDPNFPWIWGVSLSGRGDFQPVVGLWALPSSIAVGRFDDKAGADVLVWEGNIEKIFALTSFFVDFPQRQSRQAMR